MAKKTKAAASAPPDRGSSGGSSPASVTPQPVPLPLSLCKCGSPRALPVGTPNRVERRGEIEGRHYKAILRQRVRCVDCSQIRFEAAYE